MARPQKNTITKTITLTQTTMEQIEQLVKEKRIDGVSLSSSLRSIVTQLYNEMVKAPYKHQSINKAKEDERKAQEKFEAMTDEDYANEIKGKIVSNAEGKKFVLLLSSSGIEPRIPLANFKNNAKNVSGTIGRVGVHQEELGKGREVETALTENEKLRLKSTYGFIFSD